MQSPCSAILVRLTGTHPSQNTSQPPPLVVQEATSNDIHVSRCGCLSRARPRSPSLPAAHKPSAWPAPRDHGGGCRDAACSRHCIPQPPFTPDAVPFLPSPSPAAPAVRHRRSACAASAATSARAAGAFSCTWLPPHAARFVTPCLHVCSCWVRAAAAGGERVVAAVRCACGGGGGGRALRRSIGCSPLPVAPRSGTVAIDEGVTQSCSQPCHKF